MRFLGTLLVAFIILGSVGWAQYALTHRVRVDITRDADDHDGAHPTSSATHLYRLEFSPTYDTARDPFAVQLAAGVAAPQFMIRQGEHVLMQRDDAVQRGVPFFADLISFDGDFVELFVASSPAEADALLACALRIRVFRDDGVLCDDQTIWTEGAGAAVAQSIRIKLTPTLQRLDRSGERSAP